MKTVSDHECAQHVIEAEGFVAISRWLSAVIPPDASHKSACIPKGCQHGAIMPSTFLSLHYHIVFSTKDRVSHINIAWRDRLHEYLGGTVNGLDGYCQGVGGTEDHVHLLVGLNATHRLSDFMRELKKASSVWVHEEIKLKTFSWQEGYGAFTVSPTARGDVRRYIANQEEHHREKSFREELAELLMKAGVKYEDRYLD